MGNLFSSCSCLDNVHDIYLKQKKELRELNRALATKEEEKRSMMEVIKQLNRSSGSVFKSSFVTLSEEIENLKEQIAKLKESHQAVKVVVETQEQTKFYRNTKKILKTRDKTMRKVVQNKQDQVALATFVETTQDMKDDGTDDEDSQESAKKSALSIHEMEFESLLNSNSQSSSLSTPVSSSRRHEEISSLILPDNGARDLLSNKKINSTLQQNVYMS
jgi:hypothetical protein